MSRPRNTEVHKTPFHTFTGKVAAHLPKVYENLELLADGGFERVELKFKPANQVTRRDVARDKRGRVIRDAKGKPTIVDVPMFPDVDGDEMVLVERKVSYAEPDFRSNEFMAERIGGKARQAVEVTGENGSPIVFAFEEVIARVYGHASADVGNREPGDESDPEPDPFPD